MFRKILLCSDGSDRALEAARCAADLAKSQKASLTLLHVCPPPIFSESFTGAPMIAQPAFDQYVRDMHRAVMERTLPVINERGVFCETIEETGNPVASIARIAQTQDYDLIVMGSRGLAADKAAHLGSVSYGVIHQAHCPVLLTR